MDCYSIIKILKTSNKCGFNHRIKVRVSKENLEQKLGRNSLGYLVYLPIQSISSGPEKNCFL